MASDAYPPAGLTPVNKCTSTHKIIKQDSQNNKP